MDTTDFLATFNFTRSLSVDPECFVRYPVYWDVECPPPAIASSQRPTVKGCFSMSALARMPRSVLRVLCTACSRYFQVYHVPTCLFGTITYFCLLISAFFVVHVVVLLNLCHFCPIHALPLVSPEIDWFDPFAEAEDPASPYLRFERNLPWFNETKSSWIRWREPNYRDGGMYYPPDPPDEGIWPLYDRMGKWPNVDPTTLKPGNQLILRPSRLWGDPVELFYTGMKYPLHTARGEERGDLVAPYAEWFKDTS